MNWSHVDAILEVHPGRKALGEKLVKRDGFLAGHFPGRPIQPGVLTLEGLVEVAKHLICETQRASVNDPASPELVRIEKANFVQAVLPGERLFLEIEISRWEGYEVRVKGRALADETVKAHAVFVLLIGKPTESSTSSTCPKARDQVCVQRGS